MSQKPRSLQALVEALGRLFAGVGWDFDPAFYMGFDERELYRLYYKAMAEAERKRKEALNEQKEEEEGSLDTDPDLTDGDDDLQNGTVPDPSDNFNESLRANVDAALEAFNQLITQLEERGAPEEEIETLRNAFTAVYPPTPTQQGGPIDLGTLPVIPNLSGPSAVLTVENGLDDIFVELKIDLPIIGPLLESLGLGDEGKIHLRRGGRWEQPNDVLENVGGIFTDIF